MIYPDFAFYTTTQVVLFFVNCLATTLSYYWGVNIIIQVYQRNVTFKQKLLFSIISAILLNILVIYGIAWLNGIANQTGQLYIGIFQNLTKIMSPVAYIILYMLGIRILKLSRFKSLKIMQISYIYYVCCNLLLRIAGKLIFPRVSDVRGWNYLRDILAILSGTFITYIFYRIILHAIDKYKLLVDFPDNIVVKSVSNEFIKNFGICCVFYACVTVSYYYPYLDGVHLIYIFLICVSFLVIEIAIDYNKIHKANLINKEEHLVALNHYVEEFRGVKHDINNILQTYTGYINLQDIKKLSKYHQKVVSTIVATGTNVDISQRMAETPPFFSLVMRKLEKAKECGVIFQVLLPFSMKDVYIDILDFNRIIAILLDNAIEASTQTISKHVSLTSQTKPDGSKLFIISNDTIADVEVEELFETGFTTKEGHMGQGLPQIRNILHKYGNSTFNLSCYKGSFTAYLELKPSSKPMIY